MAICYNCGTQLNKENKTVEHVPAKNLYEGFSPEFKLNRITVPACNDCNNEYSKIDHQIRDVIAVRIDDESKMTDLVGKGLRSIFNHSNWKDRAHIDIDGKIKAVDFDYNELRQLHIKNFKALFFRKYGFPVPEDFMIEIIADGSGAPMDYAQFLHDYIRTEKDWDISGHPDIFKFIIKDITQNEEENVIYESEDFEKLVGVAGLLVYHSDIAAIVVAGRKEFIESCKPKDT